MADSQNESKDRGGMLAAIGQGLAAAIVGATFTAFFTLTKVEANAVRDREQMALMQNQLSDVRQQLYDSSQRLERLATQVEFVLNGDEKPRRRDRN